MVQAELTIKCAWCGLVKSGVIWHLEQPTLPLPDYSHSICPICRTQFFSGQIGYTGPFPGEGDLRTGTG